MGTLEWNQKNKLKHNRTQHKRRLIAKRKVIKHYSNGTMTCFKCGYSDIRALSIDHIEGKGGKHLKEIGRGGGYHFYLWLIENNYPSGFQVLCMNCQFIKKVLKHEYTRKKFPSKQSEMSGFLLG